MFIKKLYNRKVPAMISLELIVVLSILLFMVKKLGTLLYGWTKGFYLCNSILFLVNNYMDSGMVIENKNSDFTMICENDKLIIEIVKEEDLPVIKNFLVKEIKKKDEKYKVSCTNKKIEIIRE